MTTTQPEKTWSVGTLTYNKPKLVNVFFWMLWGDFCLNLMDSGVQPNVIPLQLKKYGASMSAIGFLTGTVVEIMSIVMVVIISTWSDRHRGPIGRRMPFMLYATPPLALCLIALGFSPEIAHWLQRTAPGFFGTMALSSLVIGVIAVTMIGYKFFDLFPQSLYYCLFADVIPQKVMGTFASLFRVCATAGSLVFSWFLLKHAEDNPELICVLAGVLYLFAFIMLAAMVREGDYPPPEPVKGGPILERFADTTRRYVRECYSLGYYWKFYLFCFCFMCGFQPFGRFLVFYGKEMTHGDLDRLGKINTARDIVQMGVFFLIGPLIDKLHPIRAALFSYILIIVAAAVSFFWIHGTWSFAVFVILTFAAVAAFQGAFLALPPRILPRQQYGQFLSANSMLWHFGLMVLLPICGRLLDVQGSRFVFAWFFAFSSVGIVMLYLLYQDWKRLGGDKDYTPPTPWLDVRAFPVVTNDAPASPVK
jgi:Na+/melibiose symporter-like transporter